MDRIQRNINNRKQDKISLVNSQPSLRSMRDGEEALFLGRNGNLTRYRREKGILWKSEMSKDGNHIIDNKLTSKSLEYTNKFIDYRTFIHNWKVDFGTSEVFIPWAGTGDQTSMNFEQTAMIAPFKMTFHKMIFRPLSVSADVDLVFRIKTQASGSSSVVTLSSYTWAGATSGDLTLEALTNHFIYLSDWDKKPTVSAEKKVAISIQPGSDPAGNTQWYATSIWRIEVII